MKSAVMVFASIALFAGAAYADGERKPILPPSPAQQEGFFFNPYVGADYQYSYVDYNMIPGSHYGYSKIYATSFEGGDLHLGARVHKYLGFEGGYFGNLSSKRERILAGPANSSVKFDGWTVDVLGYLPLGVLTDSLGEITDKIEFIGLAGVARTDAKASVRVSAVGQVFSADGRETKPRVGSGIEYWVTSKLNVRTMTVYEKADYNGVDNAIIISRFGINYQF